MQPAPIATSRGDPPAAFSQPAAPAAPPRAGARHARLPPPVITFPVIGAFYPPRALRTKTEGDVTATCAVTTGGALTQCLIDSESPEGFGFGAATLKALQQTRVQVSFRHGLQTPQALHIPIAWRLPAPGGAASPPSQP